MLRSQGLVDTRSLGRGDAGHPLLPGSVQARLRRSVVTVGRREQRTVHSPLRWDVLGTVPECEPDDVVEAVRRARAAQRTWARRPVTDRARVLRRLAGLVLDERGTALDLIQLESGKVRGHAFEEVGDVSLVAAYHARTAARQLAPRRRDGALPLLTSTVEVRHPRGVVGVISPWNYPLTMAISDALPALVAGNACVLKPAVSTPFTALWAVELAIRAGLPPDLLTVVTGAGSELGPPLIDAVDAVVFTGSTATGRLVAAQAAERLVPASLELGGKNPLLVFDDADLDAAVEGTVRGAFASAGQLCVSLERLLVHERVAGHFARRLIERTRSLRLSVELDWGGDVGTLASPAQLETVRRHVEGAVAAGARVLTGGRHRPDVGPLVHEPTVLTDVPRHAEVHREETFGPVVSLAAFRDEADAVAQANDTAYGLNASVWTRDRARGARVAAALRVGTVNVNEAYAAAWASVDAPMGGRGASGLGRRHGRDGLVRFTDVQTIARQRLMPVTSVPGLADRHNTEVFAAAVRVLGRLPRWSRRSGRWSR